MALDSDRRPSLFNASAIDIWHTTARASGRQPDAGERLLSYLAVTSAVTYHRHPPMTVDSGHATAIAILLAIAVVRRHSLSYAII